MDDYSESMTAAQNHDWKPFLIPTDSESAWRVEDAEEEIFILYSQLQGGSAHQGSSHDDDDMDNDASKESGLGSVNPKDGQITITLPVCSCQVCIERRSEKSTRQSRKTHSKRVTQSSPTEISLYQDITSLNSRKGDTGSVLWRASKKIAALILSEVLISHANLSSCQILELGAGTGFLAIAISPLVKRYIPTDLPFLIPLIAKNLSQNIPKHSNVSTEPLDWIEFQSMPLNTRFTAYKNVWMDDVIQEPSNSPRIILVVDCIYNPSLIDPLLTVINHFAVDDKEKALVLVVLELRAEDVSKLFLSRWMDSGQWEIWSLAVLGTRFAVWIGRPLRAVDMAVIA